MRICGAVIILTKGGAFALQDLDIDEPRADEILVKIVASGTARLTLTRGAPALQENEHYDHDQRGARAIKEWAKQEIIAVNVTLDLVEARRA